MDFTEHIKIREEKFGTVIFDTLREKVFVTNETGGRILKLLGEGRSLDEISEVLQSSYGANAETIAPDVRGFIANLKEHNLVK